MVDQTSTLDFFVRWANEDNGKEAKEIVPGTFSVAIPDTVSWGL
jgi:hypothetical protein